MRESLIENRQIRVFISSTFRDMQDERDYLMKRTFPKLQVLAASRDVTLTELDLRWGITEEESKSGKVVDICLREIENSVPFFIGIVGNRYGWVPCKSDLGGDVTTRFPSVNVYLERHLSVTEMEMQFGVLDRPEDMHAYFYIKDEEVEQDNPEMLSRLKKAIAESRYPSSKYSSVEDLSLQVERAFTELLDRLFPDGNLSGHQKEKLVQHSFISKLSTSYVQVEDSFQRLMEFSRDWTSPILVVTGESGLGKSALLANWSKEMQDSMDPVVIPYFSSNGGNQTATGIMKYLADEICERFGMDLPHGSEEDKLKKVLEDFSARPDRMIIVLDAVNQIADINQDKMLNWLPYPPNNVKYLFSTLQDDKTMIGFINKSYPVYCLEKLSKENKRQLVEHYLHSFGKKLTPHQIERIIEDSQSDNTLVLRTLLDELISFGVYEALDSRIDYYLNGDTVSEFYEKVLERFELDFGVNFVKRILCLIAVSRTGVSEEEMIHMTGSKRIEWSDFFCSFATHLNNQSGRFVFTHSYITSTVWERYLKSYKDYERECRWILAEELKDSPSAFAMQEVPYQLDCLESWSDLHDYIVSFPYLVYGMGYDELEVGKYWRHILENMKNEYSLKDYLVELEQLSTEDVSVLYDNLMRLCGVIYEMHLQKDFAGLQLNLISKHPSLATAEAYLTIASCMNRPAIFEYARKSLDLFKQKGDVRGEIKAYGILGSAYFDAACRENSDEDASKAYEMWEKCKDMSVRLYGELHPAVIQGYRDMSLVCDDDPDKALALAKKALDLSIAFYGPDHPDDGRSYHYVGVMYRERKEWEKALYYFQQACRVWKPAYGFYHEIMNSSYGNQGKALMNLGRLDEALQCYDKCLEILSVITDEPGYDYAVVMLNRAKIFKEMHRYDDSRDTCIKALDVLRNERVISEARGKELMSNCEEFINQLQSFTC